MATYITTKTMPARNLLRIANGIAYERTLMMNKKTSGSVRDLLIRFDQSGITDNDSNVTIKFERNGHGKETSRITTGDYTVWVNREQTYTVFNSATGESWNCKTLHDLDKALHIID